MRSIVPPSASAPVLRNAKLAMTPENIKPLLENAKEVLARLNDTTTTLIFEGRVSVGGPLAPVALWVLWTQQAHARRDCAFYANTNHTARRAQIGAAGVFCTRGPSLTCTSQLNFESSRERAADTTPLDIIKSISAVHASFQNNRTATRTEKTSARVRGELNIQNARALPNDAVCSSASLPSTVNAQYGM